MALFYPKRLVRRWGRIGSRRPRFKRMVISDPGELARQVEIIARLRQRHGYQAVTEVHAPTIATSAA